MPPYTSTLKTYIFSPFFSSSLFSLSLHPPPFCLSPWSSSAFSFNVFLHGPRLSVTDLAKEPMTGVQMADKNKIRHVMRYYGVTRSIPRPSLSFSLLLYLSPPLSDIHILSFSLPLKYAKKTPVDANFKHMTREVISAENTQAHTHRHIHIAFLHFLCPSLLHPYRV